jgi:4-amino-4-deoxy-L-arabinose transferase-like glycosyltransferase
MRHRWLPTPRDGGGETRGFLALALLGVTIRLIFLLLATDLRPYADESGYLYLALLWQRYSICSDALLYLWPPGYPFLLAGAIDLFGTAGIFALKLFQVVIAGGSGLMLMLLARRLFSRPTALLAGAIWCGYLPLIGFTHYLWPETIYQALFLTTLWLLVRWWQQEDREAVSDRWLVAAGICVGVSLFFKEIGLWWCLPVGGLLAFRDRGLGRWRAGSRGAVFLLAASVIVAPWTLRNFEVYERFVPVGSTLGQNVYLGMNGDYTNFDYPPALREEVGRKNAAVRDRLTSPVAPRWELSGAMNIIDRSSDNVRRGREYALDHPGYMIRTRIKRLADWATPTSFYVRHYAVDRYQGFLARPIVRRTLVTSALLLPLLVLLGAVGGISLRLPSSDLRGLLFWTLLYFSLAGALIAGMSRYRASIEPLLILLAAAFFLPGERRPRPRGAMAICVVGWILLLFLWSLNAAEVWTVARSIW